MCPRCQKNFTPKRDWQKFCSTACRKYDWFQKNYVKVLTIIVVCTLGTGLLLQAASILRPHLVGNFDPRSDENAEGQCP